MDFRNFLSSKSEKIGFFEQFLVIFSMKEASNQKMVLENVVQNFMMNMILKKNEGGRNPPPRARRPKKKARVLRGYPARKNAIERLKESSVLPLFRLPKKFDASVSYAAS